jgi:hypothetical protein
MRKSGAKAAALAVAALLALAVCGCGGGSANTDASTASAGAEERDRPTDSADAELARLRASVVNFGKAGSQAELDEAAPVVRAYIAAVASEDWAAACSHLSSELAGVAEQIAKGQDEKGCPAGTERMVPVTAGEGSTVVHARALRRRGKRVFVVYTNGDGALLAMLMRPEGGEWKIAESGPTPLS